MNELPKSAADEAAIASTAEDETAQSSDARVAAGEFAPDEGADGAEPTVDLTSAEGGSTSAEPDELTDTTVTDTSVTDTTVTDTSPPSEPSVELEPVLPAAAATTHVEPAPKPRRRRSLALRFVVSFVLGFALALGIGTGVLYAWTQQYDGRVLPGVRIGGTDLGGLTRDQAQAEIARAYGSLGAGQITLKGPEGHTTIISYADVGRGPDTAALLDAALAEGRQGGPLANLIRAPRAAIHGVTLDSLVTYDRDKLTAAVEDLAATIDRAPANAYVSADARWIRTVSPATEGRAVDKAALLTALESQLARLETPASITIDVPLVSLAPTVTTASAEAAKAAADRMTADVVVTHGEDRWTIAGANLRSLISFSTAADGTITPSFDESGLDPLLKTLAKKVDRPARDAGLKVVGSHVVATGASRDGRTLIAAGMKTAITTEIGARQAGAAASPVEAVVKSIRPKLSSADAKAYAGKMRPISSYSVFYWVIINNHWGGNIEGPATVINGTVIPAGEKFDFWKVVGDLRNAPGTGPGNAIEGGKITVTGAFGGGICTTSTTLFNAAFRAGMVPLARKNHNEFITRYPPGLDATVWIVGNTKQTMSFRNDTKYPILITRSVRPAPGNKRWLTFKIWSVPNGRTYKISNLVIRHGPRAIDTVVYDRSKPAGYVYRNNAPADGARVWVTVSIFDHGKLHWTKRYYSNYPAVNGVLIKGTG
jgi:vancomycin resistance protein YoaR